MKTYSYRIIGTSVVSDTHLTRLKDVRAVVYSYWGKCRIEYWGKTSGETNVK
jgi:hypothetical protein